MLAHLKNITPLTTLPYILGSFLIYWVRYLFWVWYLKIEMFVVEFQIEAGKRFLTQSSLRKPLLCSRGSRSKRSRMLSSRWKGRLGFITKSACRCCSPVRVMVVHFLNLLMLKISCLALIQSALRLKKKGLWNWRFRTHERHRQSGLRLTMFFELGIAPLERICLHANMLIILLLCFHTFLLLQMSLRKFFVRLLGRPQWLQALIKNKPLMNK